MIDPEHLLRLPIETRRFSYDIRDTMLYALGVGFGSDPLDELDLCFVYEDGLMALPTQLTTVAWDRSWVEASRIPWPKVIHGEQSIRLMRPLAPSGDVIAKTRIRDVQDKGSGALVHVQTCIFDAPTGEALGIATTGFFVRGGGGFGRAMRGRSSSLEIPTRAADATELARTSGNQALLYRLSGDHNPHHAIPAAARAGGFPRPILHGLCTYGFACRSAVRSICQGNPAQVEAFDARFTAPVFPGDTLCFDFWRRGEDQVTVRGTCPEREIKVLEGTIKLRATTAAN